MAIPTPLNDWKVVHNPGSATQATATKAADGAPANPPNSNFVPTLVVNSITASIACAGTAQTPIHAYLRDGTTGAGTIIWSGVMASAINGYAYIDKNDLNLPCNSGNATLEFEAAGVAASVQSVAMSGRQIGYGGV